MENLNAFLPLIALLISAIVGAIALFNFNENVGVKKAELLFKLYEKFYEQPQYSDIRKALDKEHLSQDIIAALRDEETTEIEEKLINYLNFFEFIAGLIKLKRLNFKEVDMIFHYYLVNLAKHEALRFYISNYHFENLHVLILQIKEKENG